MRKYLIVNADDFGMSHSTNEAIFDLIENGCIKSTTLIMNAPWIVEAINMSKKLENCGVGVHITHTSEWDQYKWRPLTNNACKDRNGFFYQTTEECLKSASKSELIEEAVEQIVLAKNLGVNISHIDNHMKTFRNDIKDYLDLAIRYRVGCRFSRNDYSKELVEYADNHHLVITDYLNPNGDKFKNDRVTYDSMKESYINMLNHLPEGVSEFFIHPAKESDELKAIAPDWRVRVADYCFFRSDEFKEICIKNNIQIISFQDKELILKHGILRSK